MERLVLGEFDGRKSDRADQILAACKKANINGVLSSDIAKDMWAKFALLCDRLLRNARRIHARDFSDKPANRAKASDLAAQGKSESGRLGKKMLDRLSVG
jgi:hypothetical protein